MARLTYHLVPAGRWAATDPTTPLTAPSLDEEGFIHCTDGVAEMLATANRFYRELPGDFLALTVDLDGCGSRWRIDDPGTPYPHIYGAIDRVAILKVEPFVRTTDGVFIAIGDHTD